MLPPAPESTSLRSLLCDLRCPLPVICPPHRSLACMNLSPACLLRCWLTELLWLKGELRRLLDWLLPSFIKRASARSSKLSSDLLRR